MSPANDTLWTTDVELVALTEWAEGRKQAVEIGTWKGRSALAIAQGQPDDGHLWCVDDFSGDPEPGLRRRCFPQSFDPDDVEEVVAEWGCQLAGYLHRVELVRARSDVTSARFGEGTLDFLFLDACHHLAAVRDDLDCWAAKMKPDGLLCGHDWTEADVIRALMERFPGHIETGPGRLWRIRR